ncbi:DUF1439 domain-containing protein [Shewanella maritima]|uniref:DUF1439 domain-containing protein n=1 Tax=Shewanella maritima TaxID=2520507 RepID=UPI003735CD0E
MRLFKMCLILMTAVLTGCASQYSISERDIERYLNNQMHFEVKQGNQLIGFMIELNDMNVELGHKPETMAVTANAEVTVSNPIFPISAKLKATFEAKPWYDKDSKSIYLKHLDLIDVESEPEDIQAAIEQISPRLMQFVSQFLTTQPVYTLDETDSNQALMAKLAEEIEIKQGKIIIKLK